MPSSDPLVFIAGDPGGNFGFVDGVGAAAKFKDPFDIKLSADTTGLYIADAGNKAIRVMDTTTFGVSTLTTWIGALWPWAVTIGPISGDLYVSVGGTGTNQTHIYRVDSGGLKTLIGSTSGSFRCLDIDPTESFIVGTWGDTLFGSQFSADKQIFTIASGIFTIVAAEGAFPFVGGPPGALTHNTARFFVTRDYIYPSEEGMYLFDAADGSQLDLFSPYDMPPRWAIDPGVSMTRGPTAGPSMAISRHSYGVPMGTPSIIEWDYNPTTYLPVPLLGPGVFRGAVPYAILVMTGVSYVNDAYFTSASPWFGLGAPDGFFGSQTGDPIYGHAIFMAGEIVPLVIPPVQLIAVCPPLIPRSGLQICGA